MKLPLIKGTRVDDGAEWRDFLPQNLVGFAQSIGGWTGFMRTADGLQSYATGLGIDRGGIWSDRFKKHFRVSGEYFIEVGQFGEVTDLSNSLAIGGSGNVSLDNSFNSVAFVANGNYYRWTTSTPLANITKPAGAGSFIDMVWIDGYYIFTDGENLWNTNLADETTFGANERSGSDFAPDQIVGVGRSTDDKLLAFNRYTTDRFYNNGGTLFPFARIPNASYPIGIVGTHAKVNIGNGRWVIFGGGKEYSPSFYLITNTFQNIASKEIDSIIDTYSDYELVNIALEFRDTRDQQLVICHLPNHCLVYDVTLSGYLQTPIWYTWTSGTSPWRGINGVYDPRNVDNAASSWIYGDKQGTNIGKLDSTSCTQYDASVEWICSTPIVRAGKTIPQAEIISAPGHSSVANDSVFLSTTKDGALYGPEIPISRGSQGDYQHRMILRRLGDYPQWFGVKLRGYSSGVFSMAGIEI